MANVRRPTEGPMSPGGEYPETTGMTRRETLVNGAKLVAGAGIGAQIMAATGADTAIAKQVRSVAQPGRGTSRATARSSGPGRLLLPPASRSSSSARPGRR